MNKFNLEELVAYCKNYGYIFQGSEIYGGLANSWDFGPLGTLLKNNLKNAWWKKMVQESSMNVGLDSAILMNPNVWRASGHLTNFNDPLTDCKSCKMRYRADKLIYDFSKGQVIADGWTNQELLDYLTNEKVYCPTCGKLDYTPIRQFNMMFKTNQGVIEDEKNTIYLRPETAQGIFVNFKNVARTMRKKIPFGIAQIGKVFRNEITPGNFIFRIREFEQMELEFFCKPKTELYWFETLLASCQKFLADLGLAQDNLRVRYHDKEELAFYSNATADIEFLFPWGFGELWGIASRTDYDLTKHQNLSLENLEYMDPETNEKYIPYVVEPSVGVERLILAILFSAYDKEQLATDEREVLRLKPFLAPYKANILPLIKKVHAEKAQEVFDLLAKEFSVSYDESQNIGKRYRRADAIGTPYCITIDDNTLNNNLVTIRDRDTMEQETVAINDLVAYLKNKVAF